MLSVYLFALGAGIVLVGLSLIGIGGHETDTGDSTEMNLDANPSLDLDGAHIDGSLTVDSVGLDAHADLDPSGVPDVQASPSLPDSVEDLQEFAELNVEAPHTTGEHHIEGAPFALDLLLVLVSFRFWSFFALFFGITGTGLTFIGESGPTLTLIISLAMGTFAGYGAHWLTRRLLRWQTTSHLDELTQLKDATGEVIIPIEPGKPGRVRFIHKGTMVDRRAYAGMEAIPAGAKVRIVRMDSVSVWVRKVDG